MLYFDKRIRYLHYYESGVKLQSAGYVNFQVRDQRCLMNERHKINGKWDGKDLAGVRMCL